MRWTTFFSFLFLGADLAFSSHECSLPTALRDEILSYQSFVDEVILAVTNGSYARKLYDDLSEFIDTFGNRLAGTENLENSIEYLRTRTAKSGLRVRKHSFEIPYWVRGEESAKMLSPRVKDLKILGVGLSAGTNSSGILADVVVVSDFEELAEKEDEISGKIVLFNAIFTTYDKTSIYRKDGPAAASKLGAVAALIRSITPFSIYSPHTGRTYYGDSKPIPAAAITLEDADMMARMYKAGQKITVLLKMEAHYEGRRTTNNLIFDLKGSRLPKQLVTVSGHIDSWDVGQGAMDDGVGAFLALHSIFLLKHLNVPKPKRTIRGILWSAEEEGRIGAKTYFRTFREELDHWTAALESDGGLYKPLGLTFNGTQSACCIMNEIMQLFENLNATTLRTSDSVGTDIALLSEYGVPLIEPLHGTNNYMWFHHTDGDSLRTQDPLMVDYNLALFSATSYILADLSQALPKPHSDSRPTPPLE